MVSANPGFPPIRLLIVTASRAESSELRFEKIEKKARQLILFIGLGLSPSSIPTYFIAFETITEVFFSALSLVFCSDCLPASSPNSA